jgi:HD-GYP domain-containing protein (c-di-GMP phosphodiesterase class II)
MNISTAAVIPTRWAPKAFPTSVRILTISDVFAALVEDRRYKPPMTRPKAYEILCEMRGKLEAPLVGAFREVALVP